MLRSDAEEVVLRDASVVLIGPLEAGDEAAISSWFAGLGPETRYARFFGWVKQLDRWTQVELAHIDHIDREAIAARAPNGATVGIARYMPTLEPGTAEVAVAVADEWRGRGLATLLLERVAARARAVGLQRFVADCLITNQTVIRLLSRLGATTIGPPSAGIVTLRIDLTTASANTPQQR